MACLIEKTKIYGVDGIGAEDPALKRTDDAAGLTCSVGESEIKSDFDLCYPWSDMQEVTDKEGNVFVKIPKFYSKYSENADGTKRLQISGVRYEGFSTLFIDGKGNEIDHVLVGKYEGSGSAEKVLSKSGQTVLVNVSLDEVRTGCRANGKGYQGFDFLIYSAICQLFMVEFATTDSQSIMKGYTFDNAAALQTGHTDEVATPSGSPVSNSDGQHACKYRGMENLWGNVWKRTDGISFKSEKIFVCADPDGYSAGKTDSPYAYVGSNGLFANADTDRGFVIKTMQLEKFPLLMFPTQIGGSRSTHFCDMVYFGETGVTLSTGGFFDGGYNAGLFASSALSVADEKHVNAGCRLCYKPL